MWVADGDGVGDGGGFGFVLGQVSSTVSHYTWLWRVIRPRRAAADGLGWAGPGGGRVVCNLVLMAHLKCRQLFSSCTYTYIYI